MDNNKVETLKEVLELEVAIENKQAELSGLRSQRYQAAPNPPVCPKISKPPYPQIKSQVKYNLVITLVPFGVAAFFGFISLFASGMLGFSVFLFFAAVIWIIVYSVAIYAKKRDEDIRQIRNSVEYKNQCVAVDEEFNRQLREVNQKYETEKNIYEMETLPNYHKLLDEWTVQHNQKIQLAESELTSARDKLSAIYEQTKIVPIQYRNIGALRYIYDMISTSDYDITYAIDSYEKQQQRMLEQARLHEQQLANQLADEQSQLLYEQNQIAAKARRDANISSAIGIIQHHNTNKILRGK